MKSYLYKAKFVLAELSITKMLIIKMDTIITIEMLLHSYRIDSEHNKNICGHKLR